MSRSNEHRKDLGLPASEVVQMVEMKGSKAPSVFHIRPLEQSDSYPTENSTAYQSRQSDEQHPNKDEDGAIPFFSNPFRKSHWRKHKRRIIIAQIVHVLFILVVLLLIFFAIIPALTRRIVNDSEFSIQALSLTNINDENIDIAVSQSIGSVPFNPRISAFTAEVYTASNDHILDIAIPAFSGQYVEVPTQRASILNATALGLLGATLVDNDAKLFLVGSTTVRVLGKNVEVSFNKSVGLTALDLQVSVQSVNKTNGVATAIASIKSSGQVSIDLGQSTIDLLFGPAQSAIARLTGALKLAPVTNSVSLTLIPLITTATLSQLTDNVELVAEIARGTITATVAGRFNNASAWANQTIQAVRKPINITSSQLLAALA